MPDDAAHTLALSEQIRVIEIYGSERSMGTGLSPPFLRFARFGSTKIFI